MRIVPLVIAISSLIPTVLLAVPPTGATGHGDGTTTAQPSADAASAIKTFKFDQGLSVSLFASEPLLANGVAFSPDEQGRWFIAESYRQEKGIEDNRGHMNWLDDDIASRTVEDRLAFMRKFYPDAAKFSEKFEKYEERIVCVEDADNNGVADKATIFADGFRDPLDGTGAGVLARGNEVWWTCIPNLWRFTDSNRDGKAEAKDKLLTGFGVKFAFRGHDMHGLRFGPDGKLYFTIGDRAMNVQNKEGKRIEETETGSVMRCNPDGTGFEIFATGVRNPQELAFNEYGDLFTGDNNSDGGDKARFVQIVEGGDCGWRMAFQYLNDRGPWNREKLWDDKEGKNAKYLIPPIANIGAGPSGLTYNPGTGLSTKYNGHFFMSDFRGGASASVVHDIVLEPHGAWYRVKEKDEFVKGVLTTDVEFGPDGALYVLDWVESWGGVGKGRIYRFAARDADHGAQDDTKTILSAGFAQRSDDELVKLLVHADQRVRQGAQLALAAKGQAAAPIFAKIAQHGPTQLARIHAIWGLGQLAEKDAKAAAPLLGLLSDPDAEVRAQAAKVLGDRRLPAAGDKLTPLLADGNARVRFHAALALGRIGYKGAFDPLCKVLADNGDKDPILRHGAVMGLVGIGDAKKLAARKDDPNVSVRIGAVVALRRLKSPAVADFLHDASEDVVIEAARAIHDVPIVEAFPALAALANSGSTKNPRILERSVNAAYRIGGPDQAKSLAAYAAKGDAPEGSRKDALDALADWANPNPKDRVLNQWRPLPQRTNADATAAIAGVLPALLTKGSPAVQEEAARLSQKLGIGAAAQPLADLALNEKGSTGARIAALQALRSLKDPRLPQIAKSAMSAKDEKLRSEALKSLAGEDAVQAIAKVIETGSVREKQGGIVALSQMNTRESRAQIVALMDRLMAGQCPPEIQLDVYEAAKKAGLGDRAQQYKNALPKDDPLANYRLSLMGGDADRGRKIFREKAEVQCLRCHKCEIGDSPVGPDLTKIGALRDRNYLLQAVVTPNAVIAPGFQLVTLTMKDNQMVAGRLLKEADNTLTVETMDEAGKPKTVNVPAGDVKERLSAPSPMPENIRDQLSRSELRDIIEYLATRK